MLLRFHKNLQLVQNRIDVIKYFNPGISIYGLFGGNKDEYPIFRKKLKQVEHILFWDESDTDVKWRFSDLSILFWYENYGKSLNFDILHTIEYDLVLLDSFQNLYEYNPQDKHIYVTALVELEKIKPISNWFNNPEFPTKQCREIVRIFKEKYGLEKLYSCMAPGTTITREFLDNYRKIELPTIGFDEIRIPNIAQALNIPVESPGFVRDWFDRITIDFRLFNTNNHVVNIDDLYKYYKLGYQKAFHHVYDEIDIERLEK
ncbi:hypothetical protein GF389_02950 [Candidatus Dojkabacteria bacterium]|nr:hypothetical protein [Candidatus Dojkabacteria bacterium]